MNDLVPTNIDKAWCSRFSFAAINRMHIQYLLKKVIATTRKFSFLCICSFLAIMIRHLPSMFILVYGGNLYHKTLCLRLFRWCIPLKYSPPYFFFFFFEINLLHKPSWLSDMHKLDIVMKSFHFSFLKHSEDPDSPRDALLSMIWQKDSSTRPCLFSNLAKSVKCLINFLQDPRIHIPRQLYWL